ncbi:MAG: DUF4338 domain-containing protein [Desulfotignum sp.]|nr:DUF4338 domain-containing protein [Desulfotignum sp.]MCF8126471.1 DUF4338 domain-containing protein [Desulfotignum sp.]
MKPQTFCGRNFSTEDLLMMQEVVTTCGGISRYELAHTVCELLEWKCPGGGLKARECKDLLEILGEKKVLELSEKRKTGYIGSQKFKEEAQEEVPYSGPTGSVEAFSPLDVELIQTRKQRDLFRNLLSRYHYLGYATLFGARLQYLVHATRPRREVVGCIQFSSPAWRMKARDQWIGRDDDTRATGLQQVVNNSRFLVLAHIRNLASSMLSDVLGRLVDDWRKQYGISPVLVETLVDRKRYHGGCYHAANWIELGKTSGRGRMDRSGKRHGAEVKKLLVYPLVKNVQQRLKQGV